MQNSLQKLHQHSIKADHLVLVDEELYEHCKLNLTYNLYDELVKQSPQVQHDSASILHEDDQLFQVFSISATDQEKKIVKKTEGVYDSANEGQKPNEPCDKIIKCKCAKTKCQKNYCDCFKAGVACGMLCLCFECFNDEKTHHSLEHFQNSMTVCKCRKTKCLKNYCECHSAGKRCSSACKCLDCHNILSMDKFDGTVSEEILNETEELEELVNCYPRKIVKQQSQIILPGFVAKMSFEEGKFF